VTDAGLAHIEGLWKLTELWLGATRVTDAGLAHIEGLTNLVTLDLDRTAVTDAGVAPLRAKLPACEIHRDDTPREGIPTRYADRFNRRMAVYDL
jgi:hypothetical protein